MLVHAIPGNVSYEFADVRASLTHTGQKDFPRNIFTIMLAPLY
jgi:hypothetical protein